MIKPQDLFDLTADTHAGLFTGLDEVWQALDLIKSHTEKAVQQAGGLPEDLPFMGETLAKTVVVYEGRVYQEGFKLLGGDPTKNQMMVEINGDRVTNASVLHAGAVLMDMDIHLAPGCKVEPGALIKGPSFIGPGTEVRQGAYLRGACLIGAGCVVGHTTEVKNSVMLDDAKAGHFAYLGDSILGRGVNLGAGTKLANLKFIDRPYSFKIGEEAYVVKRRKFGAIMGDNVETGCNSVTNPGVVLGKRAMIAPCTQVSGGYYKARTIIR